MKVGIIAPIKLLSKCCITSTQYCLPRLLVESEEYKRFYQGASKRGHYIILDTVKVGWKREPEDYSIVREALGIIKPSLVVTPSYMYDYQRTIRAHQNFKRKFKLTNLAVCLEGTCLKEVQKCQKALPGFKSYALPAHLYRFAKDSVRVNLYLDNSTSIEELDPFEGTLVTSLPVRLGLVGRLLSDYSPSPPSLGFYEEPKFLEVVERNVKGVISYYER